MSVCCEYLAGNQGSFQGLAAGSLWLRGSAKNTKGFYTTLNIFNWVLPEPSSLIRVSYRSKLCKEL